MNDVTADAWSRSSSDKANYIWLVYTDEAGVVETAGVYSTAEKAMAVRARAEKVSGMKWSMRAMNPIDSAWGN